MDMFDTTGATSGAGTAYPFRVNPWRVSGKLLFVLKLQFPAIS